MSRTATPALVVLMALALAACSSAPTQLSDIPAAAAEAEASDAPETGDQRTPAELVAATVQIDMHAGRGSAEETLVGTGSGTIITPTGLILTNAHVAQPDALGLAVQYQSPGGAGLGLDRLVIRMTEQEDRPPVERYEASVVAVDGYLDIAVIQIDATADGDSLDADSLDLPWVPLGDSDELSIRDEITVIGFPGIGGNTVSSDTDEISGFLDDPKTGPRGWIKTSAVVHYGNSGGLTANAAGQLVAVPTRAPDEEDPTDVGGFRLLRPVNLARPVIDAAMAGDDYGDTPYVEPGTGREEISFTGWAQGDAEGCAEDEIVTGYGPGTTTIRATFSWSGFEPGVDWLLWWLKDMGTADETIVFAEHGTWEIEPSGSCLSFWVTDPAGLEEGTYTAAFFAGPALEPLFISPPIAVGGAPVEPGAGEVRPGGRVLDSASGQGVADASIFLLDDQTDIDAWLEAPTPEEVVSEGLTAADGSFQLDRAISATEIYQVVIAAYGYQLWVGTLGPLGEGTTSLGDVTLAPIGP